MRSSEQAVPLVVMNRREQPAPLRVVRRDATGLIEDLPSTVIKDVSHHNPSNLLEPP
jgi:hypothetical protein